MQDEAVALPFLIAHGALVWKLALVGWVLVAVGAFVLVRRLRARREVARRAAHQAQHRDAIRGTLRASTEGVALATLEATIHYMAPVALTEAAPSPTHTSWAAKEVWIETPDGRIDLEGAPEVLAGSHAVVQHRGVPAETSDELLAEAQARAGWVHRVGKPDGHVDTATLRTLRTGDAVVIVGAREATPSDEVSGYREAATAWALRSPAAKPLAIVAERPRPALARLPIFGMVMLAAGAAIIGYGIERQLGAHWEETCQRLDDDAPFDISGAHACSLAAATPKYRELALDRISWRVRDASPPTQYTAGLALALAAERGDCDEQIEIAMMLHRYETARTVAHRCGDRRSEHVALISDARFAEAADIVVPGEENLAALPTVPTLIAAGRFTDAAVAVEERAKRARTAADEEPANRERAGTHFQCLADLLRHHGGDATALGRLRTAHAGPYGSVCTPMLVEAVPVAERPALLAELGNRDLPRYWATDTMLGAIATIEGVSVDTLTDELPYVHESPEQVLVTPQDLASSSELGLAWLLDLGRERLIASPTTGETVLRWLAVTRTLDGDIPTATALARRALPMTHTGMGGRYELRDRPHLPAVVALYTPATDAHVDLVHPEGVDADFAEMVTDNWHHHFGRLLLRSGQSIEKAYFGPQEDYKVALHEAQLGDGLALARVIGKRTAWWSEGDIAAVLPRVKTHRAELVEAVSSARRSWSSGGSLDYHYPFSLIGLFAERRAMYQLAGVTAAAAVWQARYDRVDAALSDRRRIVPLMIWDR